MQKPSSGGALQISVDGLAASGKGFVAKAIADIFALPYMDSGKLYRIIALFLLRSKIDFHSESNVNSYLLDPVQSSLSLTIMEEYRKLMNGLDDSMVSDALSEDIAIVASIVAPYKCVRNFLLDMQRDFAKNGAVIDGRDIGMAILPNADYKIYVIADVRIRAIRRILQIKNNIDDISENEIIYMVDQINRRDYLDMNRINAPLPRPQALPVDFMLLDNSIDRNYEEMKSFIKSLIYSNSK